ncbi:2-methylisoborneol synthase [Streptomyces sp. SID5785]|uniref:family 2 encapsulin nanocompartment cargo protein terpene cyclase n=1 Tax=Streptomyces sp. SID5785 TaxID=2690309 RepID=UPI001360EDBB|nr:family 2 encapsulin nanocompartment cargo protein terpene cyclase [Streptomyces sp. SID5785]MZD10446.1 2-methylisoborneol synthase [Streptomyces sp. SID5785]
MPAPEPTPPRPSPTAAAPPVGAHVLADAAARARDIAAVFGAPLAAAPPGTSTAPAPPSPSPSPSPPSEGTPAPGAGLARVLGGPTGLGTSGLSFSPRPESFAAPETQVAGTPVPGLYFHPVPDPDPARVDEVSRRIKAWALDEVALYPDDWEEEFDGFSVGRYMVACHPDAPTVDHVMIATRLMVAENAVDDCYCEDHGGSPVGLGERLLLAHTALDPLYTTEEYQPQWARSLHADAPRRAYRSAMEYFVRSGSASQADRYRHDMARLHLGYLAEASWAQESKVPEVWEYLAMRQFNNFRPCPTITDIVGGYELPADLHAMAAMQKVIALAGNATTIVNDLYSYTKELDAPGRHLNLPVVIAEREDLGERAAYLKAVEVHNELMHAFETQAAALAAACPVPTLLRFLRGVAAWVDGNHYWHRTNTYRYTLPDFW